MGVALSEDRLDRVFELLSDGQRRHLCSRLLERENHPVPVQELVDAAVGYRADDRGTESVFSEAGVEIRVVHCHLPMFADADVLDYEHGDDEVRLRDTPVVEFLTAMHAEELLECVGMAGGVQASGS